MILDYSMAACRGEDARRTKFELTPAPLGTILMIVEWVVLPAMFASVGLRVRGSYKLRLHAISKLILVSVWDGEGGNIILTKRYDMEFQ